MKNWDIQIIANKKNKIGFEELRKIAKKSGYKVIEENENENVCGITIEKNKVGQPRKNISKEVILEMRKRGNTIKTISETLGVARSTIYNYLK